MTWMIVRRIGRAVVVLLAVSLVTMLLMDFVPGDPAYAILGDAATPEQVAAVHHELRLDRPLTERYVRWLGDVLTGNLGESSRSGQSVAGAIVDRIPVTFELAILALATSLAVAIPVGVWTAYRADRPVDRVASTVSSVLISIPPFVSGLILVYLFAVRFRMLPVGGWVAFGEDPLENLRYAALPALTLALSEIAVFSRLLRADMMSTLSSEFVLAARARGLSQRYVLARHALRPSSFSLLTLSGLSLGRLVGGALVVEVIFGLPGIGRLMIDAIEASDLVMVQGTVMFVAFAYVVVNMLVDLAYGVLDPRVRVAAS